MGILGGIGSGKSSVVRNVSGFRLHIIDADKIGHELLTHADIQYQLRSQFGDDIFSGPSTVNRAALAALVFGKTAAHEARRQHLNSILHPVIRENIHQQINDVSPDIDAVVLDAALLLEGGWDVVCDWLVFIDTPQELRQQRVLETRGWTTQELNRREASQWSIQSKKERADFVIDNSNTMKKSARQIQQLFASILPPKK